jgi:hypothetical protein
MTAILTHFLGPTKYRGSRYKADAGDGRTLTVEAVPRLGSEENHYRVARLLIEKYGLYPNVEPGAKYGEWFSGGTKDGFAFVCTVDNAKLTVPAAAA